ncbi:MAG: hypothetical protein Kow00129_13380 [Thermoleophilia bacterium]
MAEAEARTTADPVIKQYREQISDNDLKILEALNKRIKLVAKLKAYKQSQGIGFVDPAREDWILTYLSRSNQGPLSAEGLREIYRVILEVTKGEVAQLEEKTGAAR